MSQSDLAVMREHQTAAGLRIELGGRVQGVGFRPWVHSVATAIGIRGRVFNAGSRVVVEAFGNADALDIFVSRLSSPPMPAAAVDDVCITQIVDDSASSQTARPGASFQIDETAAGAGERTPCIPPDLTLCDDCRRELFDPATVTHPHVLRDPTRGALASALCEIAVASRVGIRIAQADVPVRPTVHGACELLGFDPLYVACEGRFVAILPEADTARALAALHSCPEGAHARWVGRVVADDPGRVVLLHTRIGSHRLLERLSGEQLPRIC